jgi:putative CocE/NonD family hydrolase
MGTLLSTNVAASTALSTRPQVQCLPRCVTVFSGKALLDLRRSALLAAALLPLATLTFLARGALQSQSSPGSTAVKNLTKDVAAPMRDGVVLRADILLPSATGRFPTLVYRTPYGKQFALKEGSTFEKAVARGYAVVIQDVRGRYASDDEFLPYQNESRDGYDTIEWAAKQSWSDGNVGTFGLSYPGAVQWLAAIENPPHLKAMVPAMTFSTPRNFFYSGGVFDGSWLDWIWFNVAPDLRRRKNLPGPQARSEAAAAWKEQHARMQNFLPLRDLPDLKQVAPFYYEWLSHPPSDTWWDWAELRDKYDRVHAAVLNFSGWYDEAYGPDGATTNFNGLLAARRGEKNPRTRTIIGPWTHGGQNESKSGERDFGPSAPIDYDELILRWMDRYVRGIENGVEREKPVRLFVMGDNGWRDEESWPPRSAKETSYFLNAETTSSRIGSLDSASLASSVLTSEFVSDPAHPLTDPYTAYGAHDYRSLAGRDDVLVFDTAPLSADTEVTGPIRAEIYASADVRDFDLWVRLLDVSPDGTAFNLMSPGLDVLRTSYRNAARLPELLTPGKIYLLSLNRMMTSNAFLAGHRIRVQISAAFSPHFSRNLQTGKCEISSSQTQVGHIRIYHDAEHPSRIVLPVIPRAKN